VANGPATLTRSRIASALLLPILIPASSFACAVCSGADSNNAALGSAFNIAITLLLGVTMGLIGGGIAWFYRLEQRRKASDARLIARLDLAPAPASAP